MRDLHILSESIQRRRRHRYYAHASPGYYWRHAAAESILHASQGVSERLSESAVRETEPPVVASEHGPADGSRN